MKRLHKIKLQFKNSTGFTFLQSKKANPLLQFKNSGFTMLEAMVAIAVVAVIGIIISDLLSRTFKGSSRTKILSKVVQNGQTALNKIDSNLRRSDSVVCIGNLPANPSPNSAIVVSQNSMYSRYSFVPATSNANGYIQEESLIVTELPPNLPDLCSFSNVPNKFSIGAATVITDTNTQAGVSVSYGSFALSTLEGFRDAITVIFKIGPAVKSPLGYENQPGSSGDTEFKTTVQLR